MNTRVFMVMVLGLLCLFSCRHKTTEDKAVRAPSSVQTHTYDSVDEIPGNKTETEPDSIAVTPVEHAAFVMTLEGQTLYVDPIGEAEDYARFKKPDLVLITDIHADHFLPKTLTAIVDTTTTLIMPGAVYEKTPENLKKQAKVIKNGEEADFSDIHIKAVPMYNLREEAKEFHPKGRGNGYVLEAAGKRIYISGDTEDIPEMRALKGIDLAFLCMNLPYTMTVDQAIDVVLDFKPHKVYPYHYRGAEGFSDVKRFQKEVEAANPDIRVELLNWYPEQQVD